MRDGWNRVTLDNVARIVNGGTPKTKVSEYWGGVHQWITPAEMGNLENPYIAESRRQLSDAGLKHSSATLVPAGSVILSTRAPIGHVVINEVPMAFNQGCRAIIPSGELDHKYLYYFLYGNKNLLNDLGAGTTFKELAVGKLKQVKIPLPPLPEQKRIVAILDEAFAGIETAIANTEKNLANARELFESYLNAAVTKNASGWDKCKMLECASLVSTGPFGSLLHKSDYVSDGVPLVNPINITDSGIFPDDKKRVSEETKKRLKPYVLQEGDVVVARRGEIGRCAVVREGQAGWVCGTGCFFIRSLSNINPSYLTHLIRSFYYRDKLERLSSGATMKNLSNKALSNLMIALPNKAEQDSIVEEIEDLSRQASELKLIYEQKLTALAELKQSLLQKAFSGELTAKAGNDVEEAMA